MAASLVRPPAGRFPLAWLAALVATATLLLQVLPDPITTVGECASTPSQHLNGWAGLYAALLVGAFAGLRQLLGPGAGAAALAALGVSLLPLAVSAGVFLLLSAGATENFIRQQGLWTTFYRAGCYGDPEVSGDWPLAAPAAAAYWLLLAGLLAWWRGRPGRAAPASAPL